MSTQAEQALRILETGHRIAGGQVDLPDINPAIETVRTGERGAAGEGLMPAPEPFRTAQASAFTNRVWVG
ncbi:MAG: hypothetical protein PVF91_08175 [Chromatiales bacterium]|jgi:hypothetical protein